MRIAIYARKSTESEDRQVQSLEDQIRELKALAKREGLHVVEVFEESRSAKAPYTRPDFARLVAAIQEGRIDGVLTWSINRLARNPVDGGMMAYLLQTEQLQMIRTIERLYRPEDNALLMSIETGMATAYIQDLKRNVKRGRRGKVERGWLPGKAPLGYLNNSDTKEIYPDPERFPIVRKGWDMLLSGEYSVNEIYRRLKAMGLSAHSKKKPRSPISRTRIQSLFHSRFYVGEIVFCGETYAGRHQPMVTRVEFDKAQEILSRSSWKLPKAKKRLPFAGTFPCPACGAAIVGEVKTKRYPSTNRTAYYTYYHCSGARGCTKCGVREEDIVAYAEPLVGSFKMTPGTAAWLREALVESLEKDAITTAESLGEVHQNHAKAETRLKRLALMKADGDISEREYQTLRDELMEAKTAAAEEISKAQNLESQLLGHIYQRIDAAVMAGEIDRTERDPQVLGRILRLAGKHILNLKPFEIQLDPVIAKIATFEPLKDGSGSPKSGDRLPLSSVWYSLVADLRKTALDQISVEACTDAAKSRWELHRENEVRRQLHERHGIGDEPDSFGRLAA